MCIYIYTYIWGCAVKYVYINTCIYIYLAGYNWVPIWLPSIPTDHHVDGYGCSKPQDSESIKNSGKQELIVTSCMYVYVTSYFQVFNFSTYFEVVVE